MSPPADHADDRRAGFDPDDPYCRPLVDAQASIAYEGLAETRTLPEIAALVDDAHAFGDAATDEITARARIDNRLLPVCREGCASCCHGTTVLVSAPEIVRIAGHLRETLSDEALASLREKLASWSARTAPMSEQERHHAAEPCPLLDRATGACTVHDVRPFPCRAYNSCSVRACEDALARRAAPGALPSSPLQFNAHHAVSFGLMTAFHARAIDVGPYELGHGLHEALDDDALALEWLEGRRCFSHVRVSETAREAYAAALFRLAEALGRRVARDAD